jgi:hypothetical protein
MTRRKQPALVGLQVAFPQSKFFHLDRSDLEYIRDVLNRKPQGGRPLYGEPLTRLMKRLEECGGNLQKMMDGDPELAETLSKVCVTRWMPSTTGRAYLVLQPSVEIQALSPMPKPQDAQERAELFAALYFHVWTLNPEWDKLTGPCARCGQYYLKKRASQKVYCSRRCGNAATAVERTRERIASERKDKIARAKAAIKEWRSAKTQEDWKHWVARRACLDPRFLTRAVTKHDIVTPKKGR